MYRPYQPLVFRGEGLQRIPIVKSRAPLTIFHGERVWWAMDLLRYQTGALSQPQRIEDTSVKWAGTRKARSTGSFTACKSAAFQVLPTQSLRAAQLEYCWGGWLGGRSTARPYPPFPKTAEVSGSCLAGRRVTRPRRQACRSVSRWWEGLPTRNHCVMVPGYSFPI